MDFHLYAGQSAWLLVPDCMVASQTATIRRGPLQPLFQISDEHLDAQELERVMADVEDHMFAEISHDMALRIVHPGGKARSGAQTARGSTSSTHESADATRGAASLQAS